MIAVQLDHVSKRFRLHRERARSFQELFLKTIRLQRSRSKETLWALSDVSFDVERGKMVGIIGDNGAGKSTLLKLLSRVIEPTTGRVTMDGRVSAMLELGTGFHPDLTGRENAYLNGSILGIRRAEMDRLFDDIVAFSELDRFIDMPVKHYSSGMYVRLGFSIAVHARPDILLVDEVLAVGDQAFQRRCLDTINQMRRSGVTILLVSHALDMVRDLCDGAIWLKEGRIQAHGQVHQVLEQYMGYVSAIDGQAIQKTEAARSASAQPDSQRGHGDDRTSTRQTAPAWRWGSREAELVRIQLLNSRGEETRLFKTGETFVARMHYQAHQRIDQPLFGIALHHANGLHISGPNTGFAEFPIEAIEGEGTVDYIIPALPLLVGTYLFSAAVYDSSGQHAYDHHDMAYHFRVVPGSAIKERYGVVHIDSRWELHAKQALQPSASGGGEGRG